MRFVFLAAAMIMKLAQLCAHPAEPGHHPIMLIVTGLFLFGILIGESLGSARRGLCAANPDDVPSGEYTPSSVPPGLENATSLRLEVEHFTDLCMAHLFFSTAVLQLLLHETGQVEKALLKRHGLKKCFSMDR
ncbi:hypothetical protein FOZ63_006121, partial [Perkinsus olseni]